MKSKDRSKDLIDAAHLTRRNLFQYFFGLSLGAFVYHPIQLFAGGKADRVQIISPFHSHDRKEFGVACLDLNTRRLIKIKTNFLLHSVSRKPGSNILVGTEKHGPHICIIDLKSEAVSHYKTFSEKTMLYGHAIYSPDGEVILGTIKNASKGNNLAFLNARTLDIQTQISFENDFKLHDCHFLNASTVLVTQGKKVKFVDVNEKKIRSSFYLDHKSTEAWIGHGQIWDKKILYFTLNEIVSRKESKSIGKPYSLPGFFDLTNGKGELFLVPQKYKKRFHLEILSLCSSPKGDILATVSPWDNQISFWDYGKKTLVRMYNDNYPSGVSLSADKKYFVTIGNNGLRYFSVTDAQEHQFYSFKKEINQLFTDKDWLKNHFYHSISLI